VDILPSSVIL